MIWYNSSYTYGIYSLTVYITVSLDFFHLDSLYGCASLYVTLISLHWKLLVFQGDPLKKNHEYTIKIKTVTILLYNFIIYMEGDTKCTEKKQI